MARDHVAGATVSVVQNGQIVLKKGYGFAALSPNRRVDPDRTLFRIGSISKTFTWIALMNEVEAGRIRIDGPVNLYLPEQLQIRDQGFRTPVRVINLMDHSAGFEDRALGHLFERRFERVRPLAEYLRQERPRRVTAPGQIASYSNYGAALAGQALNYVSGKPFEQLIEEEILRPLALTRTTFREPHPAKPGLPAPMSADLARDLSVGYRWTPEGHEVRAFEYLEQVAPAGSASSTASDMARYMLLLLGQGTLDGVTVYGPKAALAFRTPIRRTPAGINGWRHGFIDYGLPGGYRGFGHAGATMSFMSNMVVVPALNMGVFISTNTDTGGELAEGLASQVVQQFYAPPQTFPRPGSPALSAQSQTFSGYYVGTRRARGGLEKFVGLFLDGVAVRVNDEGRLITSAGGKVRTWVPEGDLDRGVFVAADGHQRLAFQMQEGRAVGFRDALNAQSYERSGFWNRPVVLAVLAGLSGIAAASTLGGVLLRNRREHRETPVQGRASVIQNTQAVLWLTALVLFLTWAARTSDIAAVMYGWPGGSLVIASACALVASALTALSLILLPAIWRGGRRVDSWTPLRKLAFTLTALVYGAFSLILGLWGGLTPWGG
jgi:CubicO group peptidase (beta-lactamase class C family)